MYNYSMNFIVSAELKSEINRKTIEEKFDEYIGEIEEPKKTKIISFRDKIIETTLKAVELYKSSKLGYDTQDTLNVLDITLDEIFKVIQEEDKSSIHKFLDLYFINVRKEEEIQNLNDEIKTLNENNNEKDSNINLLENDLAIKLILLIY